MTKFIRAILAAVVLAIVALPAAPAPASAYTPDIGVDIWTDTHAGSGYNYHIPVCLHPNFDGGPPWDLTSSSYHKRANEAIGRWNALGSELFFYRSDSTCDYLYLNGVPYVSIGFPSQANGEATSDVGWIQPVYSMSSLDCPPGYIDCYLRVAVWINKWNTNNGLWAWSYVNAPSGNTDPAVVLTHELGHAAGLDHYNGQNGTMNTPYSAVPDPTFFSNAEKWGIWDNYGLN